MKRVLGVVHCSGARRTGVWFLCADGAVSGCWLQGPLGWNAFVSVLEAAVRLQAVATWCEAFP